MKLTKRDVFEHILLNGPVWLHFDARAAGVEVPLRFKDNPHMVLTMGFGLNPPVRDLTVTERSVSGQLRFKGEPFDCVVPWSVVFGMRGEDGRGLVWPESMPDDNERKPGPVRHLRLVHSV